jgi:hypothetical protein
MAFSIKHILFGMAFIAIGLAALRNADVRFAKQAINLLVLATVIVVAYGIWTSQGEQRAFRIGFVCWVALFWLTIRLEFDIGADQMISYANEILRPKSEVGKWITAYFQIGRSLLSLLAGLVGGWVTLFFYRKRQHMQK